MSNNQDSTPPNSDRTLRSKDGVLFKVHATEAIATPSNPHDDDDDDKVIQLPESGQLLALLLQFIRRNPEPNLTGLPLPTVADLAEAVQKYRVLRAVDICNAYMSSALDGVALGRAIDPTQALLVLAYSAKHNDINLMNRAAEHTITLPADKVRDSLPPNVFRAWTAFVKYWSDLLLSARAWRRPTNQTCSDRECWNRLFNKVITRLSPGFPALKDTTNVFTNINCDCSDRKELRYHISWDWEPSDDVGTQCRGCAAELSNWRYQVEGGIRRIPNFNTLL